MKQRTTVAYIQAVKEQQVRLVEANQVSVEERRGRGSGIFHHSRRGGEQVVASNCLLPII